MWANNEQEAPMSSYIITDRSVNLVVDGHVYSVDAGDKRYDPLIEALKRADVSDAELLEILNKTIEQALKAVEGTRLSVKDGTVLFDGRPLAAQLSDRVIRLLDEGFNLKPLSNFVERLFKNPSMRAVNELYAFLEYGRLPLTADGCFIGYKVVRSDFLDKHSGTMDNSVGKTVRMDRNAVDDDSSRTCSFGLHVCSAAYLRSFYSHGDHVMLVKVDPADVVSIPADYNNTKMRCCGYEVIGEYLEYAQDYGCRSEAHPSFDTEVYDAADDRDDDRYQEGYDDGYSDGYDAGRDSVEE